MTHKAKKKICGFPVSSYKNLGGVVLYVVLHLFILRSDCYRDKSPFGVWDLRKRKQHCFGYGLDI
jgi:hypothetical protein